MSTSAHSAIGPALGYNFQFERATYRLLQASNTVVHVGIEHVDDVSVHHAEGASILEQDKMSTKSDRTAALSDRSLALWKTIAIWCDAVATEPALLTSAEFHLVTNGNLNANSLAARIHAAKESAETIKVANEIVEIAKTVKENLRSFAERVIALPATLLASLIGRIFIFDKVSPSFGGDLEDLLSLRLLGALQRTAVFDGAAGWVRRTVLAAAEAGEPTLISRVAFDRQARALLRHVAVAPLAVIFEPHDGMIDPANYRSHGFFQQLDWIDTESTFVRDCVIHYVQAQAARMKWTDTDSVSEEILRAYEEELKIRWKLQVRRQAHRSYSSPIVQGQELLTETLSEESVLEGQTMPKAITCGSFHVLADFNSKQEPQIGWHPDYGNLAKASVKES